MIEAPHLWDTPAGVYQAKSGAWGNRTPDLLLAKQALYQLS